MRMTGCLCVNSIVMMVCDGKDENLFDTSLTFHCNKLKLAMNDNNVFS